MNVADRKRIGVGADLINYAEDRRNDGSAAGVRRAEAPRGRLLHRRPDLARGRVTSGYRIRIRVGTWFSSRAAAPGWWHMRSADLQ